MLEYFHPTFHNFYCIRLCKNHFKCCKCTEFDYTAHKMAALLFLLVSTCYQSVEHMLHVKRQIKNSQKLCCVFSLGGGKNKELKQCTSTVIDTSGFFNVFCLQPWTPPRTRARMWSAAAIRCASLRATRGPCVSIARNWSTGRWSFSPAVRWWLASCFQGMSPLFRRLLHGWDRHYCNAGVNSHWAVCQ